MDLKAFISELQLRLADGEEEIYIKVDNTLYDIEMEHHDEYFDGFYTVFPACCALIPKQEDNE